jgi:hypothetical protein
MLGPNEIGSIFLNRTSFTEGFHNVEVIISNPNGMTEERTLNNSTSSEILISERMQLANVEIEDQSTCNESATLVKTQFDGEGVVRWYDSLEDGNLLGEGSQFALTLPDTQATIYGDLLRFSNSGKTKVNPADLTLVNTQNEGISFNVNSPLRIVAFDFYSEQSGNIFIAVESGIDDNITQLDSELVRSDGSGWQTADVSIKLSPGVNYRMLYKDGTINFGRASAGGGFPYEDDEGLLEVTGDEGGIGVFYKYFFNLQAEYSDFCGRIPVEVSVSSAELDAPVALFDADISLVDFDNNQAVSFTNNSMNAVSYLWDFGDGNTSTEEEPSHTYANPGVYYASLIVRGESGCDDASVIRIDVVSNEIPTSTADIVKLNSFALAPNPVSNRLDFISVNAVEVDEIKLYNSAGQLISVYPVNNSITRHSLNLNDLSSGLYYFIIQTEGGIETHKVVKL